MVSARADAEQRIVGQCLVITTIQPWPVVVMDCCFPTAYNAQGAL